MLIFGHRFIDSPNFYHTQNIDAIENTPSNSTVYLDFREDNLDIINYCKKNEISLAIGVEDIRELIYASSLGASFILVQKELASIGSRIANNYLFDAKILVFIEDEDEIEEFAIMGVDGVIFSTAIIKTNS